MKCVAIGGVPATGKTTLVKMIYDKMPKINFEYGLVKGHYDKENNIALLGLYNQDNTFLGTDRLSMGVNKQFLQYISMAQTKIKNIQEHFGGIIGRIETYTLTNLKESETLSNNIYDWLRTQKGHNG